MEQAGCAMTMPDWPSLWKREPGLRPEGVQSPDPLDGRWLLDGDDPMSDIPISDRDGAVAALCRDAAINWLRGIGSITFSTSGHACIFMSDSTIYNPSDRWTRHGGETFDEALFNACKAVLDARE